MIEYFIKKTNITALVEKDDYGQEITKIEIK